MFTLTVVQAWMWTDHYRRVKLWHRQRGWVFLIFR